MKHPYISHVYTDTGLIVRYKTGNHIPLLYIRQVEFTADTLNLNLIDLARTGSKLISVAGRLDYSCPSGDVQDPVTFTTREAHLVRKITIIHFNQYIIYYLLYI